MEHTSPLSDAQVVARCRAEPELFAALYDRHSRAVFRYAASRLGHEAAEDLLSDTFLKALERLERFDQRAESALPWLLGIATRLIHRRRRDEAAARRVLRTAAGLAGEGSARETNDPGLDLDSRLDASAVSQTLDEAIAALKPRDRDVLMLYAVAELDSAGIADALGIPMGTVRSRLHRARRILRTRLEAGWARALETPHG